MTRLRLGILPLEIETGRFTPIYDTAIKKNRKRLRICKLCDIESCEDEFHFIFICPIICNEIHHFFSLWTNFILEDSKWNGILL